MISLVPTLTDLVIGGMWRGAWRRIGVAGAST